MTDAVTGNGVLRYAPAKSWTGVALNVKFSRVIGETGVFKGFARQLTSTARFTFTMDGSVAIMTNAFPVP